MAKVARPPGHSLAFNSVFSKPSLHGSKAKSTAIVDAEADANAIKASLRPHLKTCLGVESVTFIYGGLGGSQEFDQFRLPVRDCQSLHDLREPNGEDTTAQQTTWSKSQIWINVQMREKHIGRSSIKKLLADVMDELLPEYVNWAYRRCYRPGVVEHLRFWVRNVFAGFVKFFLMFLDADARLPLAKDILRWEEIAMTKLGALRVEELYDMTVSLKTSSEGLGQLRLFITSPATRSYLTTTFNNTLSKRLLHPGASTIEILQTYISIIRAFRQLDPKGVLLDRVARPVRRYLRERDDTIKVIVGGLLSDPFDADGNPGSSNSDNLSELAVELIKKGDLENDSNDDELDWDNMEWMPDPIDTAPDYMKAKNTDVVGNLTSLFDSKDIFIKELQTTLADRLLKNKPDFDLEISVIDHLKVRFGDSALQGCEVMLRDVLDSRKVDSIIKKDQESHSRKRKMEPLPELHAKILSRLFWPPMSEQDFVIPTSVREQQEQYEQGFEALKNSRKLTWVPSVGQVEVELQLTDRAFIEEVLPYQATVIYVFQDSSDTKTLADLSTQLSMSATLVRSACIFWVSKRILTETLPDTFMVLETLPSGSEDMSMANNASIQDNSAVAAAEAAAAQAAKEADEEDRKQKMAMYHQFVVSMLTNQGAMPLPRIAMMLGMVVPGGFPFSNEELKEFMSGMVKEGILEVGPGGNWKVAG